jgi:hypothetical protein
MSQHPGKGLAVTIEIFDAIQSSLAPVNDDNHAANRCFLRLVNSPMVAGQLKMVSA